MMGLKANRLGRLPRNLRAARRNISPGPGSARFGPLHAALLETERVPAQTQAAPGDHQKRHQRQSHQDQPTCRRQGAHESSPDRGSPHG